MKKIILLFALVLGINALAADKNSHPLAGADKVIWAGVDYSHARFIGPGEFPNADTLFPGLLDEWNNLVLQERLPFLEKELHLPVVTDINGVTEVNKSATASQIVNQPGPTDTIGESLITPDVVAQAVRSYKLQSTTGVAVVFIADRFVKLGKKGEGAVWVVVFDVGSRNVLFSERTVSKAAGFGLRNYWFRIIKNAERELAKAR